MKPVIAAILFALVAGCSDNNSHTQKTGSRLSQSEAVQIGLSAMEADMSKAHVEKYKPFNADLKQDIWHVFGTVPGGGPGGTPEAQIQDLDGAVLSVGHGQ